MVLRAAPFLLKCGRPLRHLDREVLPPGLRVPRFCLLLPGVSQERPVSALGQSSPGSRAEAGLGLRRVQAMVLPAELGVGQAMLSCRTGAAECPT